MPPAATLRVVAAWLERDGRVLIAQRAAPPAWAGWWEFPGGKVEAGETDAICLARELREELGTEVLVGKPLITVFHDEHRAAAALRRIAISVYRATVLSGEPQAREHLALAWVAPTELTAFQLLPADLIVLQMFAQD